MRSITVSAVGPFSLAASIGFLKGFGAAAFAHAPDDRLDVAFAADRDWHPVGVRMEQRESALNGQFWGEAEAEHVRSQVQRILSLDVDATEFPAIGAVDPVVGQLQAQFPGMRPVCFWSPYEAACWAVIGQGTSMAQASALKAGVAAANGSDVHVADTTLRAFPAPVELVEATVFPGLDESKPEWLRGIARHALAGDLDPFLLRDLPREEALVHLERIPGIDRMAAETVLVRGTGDPDYAPGGWPRLLRAVIRAYGLTHEPDQAEWDRITDAWRPFRSWVGFLMRRAYAGP